MSIRIYSDEQVKDLQANPNVAKCSNNSITYSKDFKIKAVKTNQETGKGPNTIFLEAGFDLRVIGKRKPKSCLRLWKKIYQAKGEKGLATESRGRKIKDQPLVDLEYLQAKVAYLEAENNFLRNLKTKNKT